MYNPKELLGAEKGEFLDISKKGIKVIYNDKD